MAEPTKPNGSFTDEGVVTPSGAKMDVSVPIKPDLDDVLRPKPRTFWESMTDPNDNVIFVLTRNAIAGALIGTYCYMLINGQDEPPGLKEVVLIVLGTFIGSGRK